MFFVVELKHKVYLKPKYLGPNIISRVTEQFYKDVEGSCTSCGYIILILKIDHISEGVIDINGLTAFTISYKALSLKPVVDEVVEGNVVEINKLGVFISVGPLNVFVSNHQIPEDLSLSEIEIDTILRAKIIGVQLDTNKIYAVGSLIDDFLGIVT